MNMQPEIRSYLKKIESELAEIDRKQKKSIIQEIEGHLLEKIEQTKGSEEGELSSSEIKKMLKEFGEPEEISKEYLRQLSDEKISKRGKGRFSVKRVIFSLIAIGIVASLIIAGFIYFGEEEEKKEVEKKIIIEGKGLDEIQIGDTLDKIIGIYGEPEERVNTNHTIGMSYREEKGIDFLLSNYTDKILEIRFNAGFHGNLESGVSIGSTLDSVRDSYNWTMKAVKTNWNGSNNFIFGTNRVLYEQANENGETTSYKFINAEEGLLIWFSKDKMVNQIVVFQPYSDEVNIQEGIGLSYIQIGDSLDTLKDLYGEPDLREDTSTTIWMNYRQKGSIDFLLDKTEKIIEIRFNTGFPGSLQSGIILGSALDTVLDAYDGALKTVETNRDGLENFIFGSNKVLYEQVDENGVITTYKFIHAEKGILYWFGSDKKVRQIVVYKPHDAKPDINTQWLGLMQTDDMQERIIGWYGAPEDMVITNKTIWMVYHELAGIDLLIDNNTKKVIEVRFNEGFDYATINQISIGSSLDDVLNIIGSANKTVQISSNDTLNLSYGTDKVLYEIVDDGNNTVAYKFIDAKRGTQYWFDSDGKSTQIVVFDPY